MIKYGGAAMADEKLREAFATDVVLLKYVGLNPVIVHGGGPEITDYMRRLGLEVEFVQGLRVSTEQTVEVAKMVLIGKLNKDIVLRLNRHGQPAVGLCGDDGSLFQVAKREVIDADGDELDLGFVGSIRHVDVNVLNHIAEDYIPVVASVGADAEGRSYNVNADEAAGAVAAALGAYKVIFLTDVEGWLADQGDPASLVSETDVAEIRRVIEAEERQRRHAAQAGGVRRCRGVGSRLRAHRGRARATLAAARAVHGCGHWDEGRQVTVGSSQSAVRRSAIELEREFMMQTYKRLPVEFVLGEGARLYDAQGGEYLDFLAGISVCNAGHCHPRIVEAIRDQAGRLQQVSNLYYNEPAARLAERLATSFEPGARVFLCNSGTEANEAAIKLARKHRRGGEIVVLEGAFHGRTMGALSATPQPDKQEPFAPLVPGFRVVPRDDPEALAAAVGDSTAAVMMEPVQGETGVWPISERMLLAAREACDRSGALLIFDEIQCGMGRTGTLWAFELTPVRPDVLTTAKALANGLPVGACIAGRRRRTSCSPATTGRPSEAGRWWPPPRSPPWTSSTTTRCCRVCACSATACAWGWRSCAPPAA